MNPRDRLPCGAAVDDLIGQVTDGATAQRTPHQADCPHCQAALAEYDRLWGPVQDLVDAPVPVPDSILEHAMRAIRTAGTNIGYGTVHTDKGDNRIADRVVAITARITAERIDGVRAALTGGDPHIDVHAAAGTLGSTAAVHLTLAVSYGTDLPALATRIRTAVATRIRDVTGLEPAEITIVIDDILTTPDLTSGQSRQRRPNIAMRA